MDEVVRLKIMYDMMRPEPRPARADDIVMQILQMVSAGPVTVRVIYTRLGQSREHISRVVKKMSEDGYLERGGGRPYRYGITRMGQARLDL